MKYFKFAIITILSCISMTGWTQDTKTKILAKSPLFFGLCPENTELDSVTNKRAIVWNPTNNAWVGGFRWIDNAPVLKKPEDVFPNLKDVPNDIEAVPMGWVLTNEGENTVLHCYMRMPADEVVQLWVANEETGILDRETGVLYRAIRTIPDVFGTHFGIRSTKGTYIDYQIYFPQLPETTKTISIYGVQNWRLSGYSKIKLWRNCSSNKSYDEAPNFRTPKIVKPERNYNKDNLQTWAVYDNVQLVKPGLEDEMALWLTKDTTYLALKCEQNWMTEYWMFPSQTKLIDQDGKLYQLRGVQGLPLDRLFLVKGYSGDYVSFLLKFDPLPLDATNITYMVPDAEPFKAWGANYKGCVINNLDVEELRANKKAFDYHERVVVK